jgi:membrane protein
MSEPRQGDTAGAADPDPGGHPRAGARSWGTVIKGAKRRIKADDVPSLAASVAFKIFLSLFPTLIAAMAIASQVVEPRRLLATIQQRPGLVLPPGMSGLIEERLQSLVDTPGAGGIALAGIAAGLWAATSAGATLVKALNRINGIVDQRGFLAQRGVALLLTLGLLVTLVVLVAGVVLGSWLRGEALQLFEVPGRLGMAGNALWNVGRGLVAVAVLIAFFAFVYWIAPNRERPQWRWISPGSITGVMGWLALSLAFGAFVRMLGAYEETYGSLAAVAITLLWLQLSMLMVLLGAEIDVEIAREERTAQALAEGAGMAVIEPAPVAPDAPAGQARRASGGPRAGTRSAPAVDWAWPETATSPMAAGLPTGVGRYQAGSSGELIRVERRRRPRLVGATVSLAALAAAIGLALRRHGPSATASSDRTS